MVDYNLFHSIDSIKVSLVAAADELNVSDRLRPTPLTNLDVLSSHAKSSKHNVNLSCQSNVERKKENYSYITSGSATPVHLI